MADSAIQSPEQPGEQEELSFSALRRLGIKFAQRLAAEDWTDYNVHDPGVTLLEQICYGLTDLIHRTGFDVADHLTSPDGDIDFESLGLELPEHIFPCRPTTEMDYRRAILDQVADVDDVTISQKEKDGAGGVLPNGLYQILVRPRPGTGEQDRVRIRSAVEAIYHASRNLCEDVEAISFVSEVKFSVCGVVEVERGVAPEVILAEIYHQCAEYVAARVRIYPFEYARRADRSLEEVFTGPLGQHGVCDESDLERTQEMSCSVSEFFSLIGQVEGVSHVCELYLKRGDNIERDSISAVATDQALRLHIPSAGDEVQIQLSSRGRLLQVPFEGFNNRLRLLALNGSGIDRTVQDVRKLYTRPHGEYRDLRQYTSIQTHLPSVYGVARHAMSESAAPDIRARTRQLKTYLLLFDQLMADYAANVDGLKNLYSRDVSSQRTYASQLFDETQIPGVGEIYPPQPADVIASVVANYDDFEERKGRLLDYLLALYGEGFNQHSLREFAIYATAGERERALLDNRVRFLRDIEALTRDRGAAIDCRDPKQALVSGLQQRVSYLLGFVDHCRKSLTAALRKQGLEPVPDDLMPAPQAEGEGACRRDSADFRLPDSRWEGEVPLLQDGASSEPGRSGQALPQLMEQVGHCLPRVDGKIGSGVLSRGISLANYRLGHLKGDAAWQALLLPDDEGPWWRLGAFTSRHEAILAINRLRRLIVLLNTESEGMHVVEHILLRPRDSAARQSTRSAADDDFFSFRLSLVFPAWTARLQDDRFRQLARETVRLNCPAHCVPEVLWLGFDEMVRFESLQAEWLRALTGKAVTRSELDAAAGPLVDFLRVRRGDACWALMPGPDNGLRSDA